MTLAGVGLGLLGRGRGVNFGGSAGLVKSSCFISQNLDITIVAQPRARRPRC